MAVVSASRLTDTEKITPNGTYDTGKLRLSGVLSIRLCDSGVSPDTSRLFACQISRLPGVKDTRESSWTPWGVVLQFFVNLQALRIRYLSSLQGHNSS